MGKTRVALANLCFPSSAEHSIALVEDAVTQASAGQCDVICFPESYVPGYRSLNHTIEGPDPAFLEAAWNRAAAAAAAGNIAVILGTERLMDDGLRNTVLVIQRDGSIAGFQDKVQLDPSEESIYTPGSGRHLFESGGLKFGICICHEGWRYPETVRWSARQGAHAVFHPHFHQAEPGSYRPTLFADPANTFHEKAMLCRAAENTCYFLSVNYASVGSPTTSAIVNPGGSLLSYQPYGEEGLLTADIDLSEATGLLAARYRTVEEWLHELD